MLHIVGCSFASNYIDYSDGILLEPPPRPVPFTYVNDYAGFLSDSTQALLEQRLCDFADTTQKTIVIITARSIKDTNAQFFSESIRSRWKTNDSLSMIIVANKPEFLIQKNIGAFIGDGLKTLDPVYERSYGIRDSVMLPKIKAGETDAAFIAGTAALISLLDGNMPEGTITNSDEAISIIALVFIWGIVSFLIAMIICYREFKKGDDPNESRLMHAFRTNFFLIWLRVFLFFFAFGFFYIRIFKLLYIVMGGRFRRLLDRWLDASGVNKTNN